MDRGNRTPPQRGAPRRSLRRKYKPVVRVACIFAEAFFVATGRLRRPACDSLRFLRYSVAPCLPVPSASSVPSKSQVQKELPVAARTRDRRWREVDAFETRGPRVFGDVGHNRFVDRRVGDQPAFLYFLSSGFELW